MQTQLNLRVILWMSVSAIQHLLANITITSGAPVSSRTMATGTIVRRLHFAESSMIVSTTQELSPRVLLKAVKPHSTLPVIGINLSAQPEMVISFWDLISQMEAVGHAPIMISAMEHLSAATLTSTLMLEQASSRTSWDAGVPDLPLNSNQHVPTMVVEPSAIMTTLLLQVVEVLVTIKMVAILMMTMMMMMTMMTMMISQWTLLSLLPLHQPLQHSVSSSDTFNYSTNITSKY